MRMNDMKNEALHLIMMMVKTTKKKSVKKTVQSIYEKK